MFVFQWWPHLCIFQLLWVCGYAFQQYHMSQVLHLFLKQLILLSVQFEVCPSESLEYLQVVGLLLECPTDSYHGLYKLYSRRVCCSHQGAKCLTLLGPTGRRGRLGCGNFDERCVHASIWPDFLPPFMTSWYLSVGQFIFLRHIGWWYLHCL
jgi:hypothetical protein